MPNTERYILVFLSVGTDEKKYFRSRHHNLLLGSVIFTYNIEEAMLMSLDRAESTLSDMTNLCEWEIWSVRNAITLDERSDRHIIRQKRKNLEKQLAELPEV